MSIKWHSSPPMIRTLEELNRLRASHAELLAAAKAVVEDDRAFINSSTLRILKAAIAHAEEPAP